MEKNSDKNKTCAKCKFGLTTYDVSETVIGKSSRGTVFKFLVLHAYPRKKDYEASEVKYKYLIHRGKFWTNLVLEINSVEDDASLMVTEVVFHPPHDRQSVKNEKKRLRAEKPIIIISEVA